MTNTGFQSVFDAALRDYGVQTGIKLIDHRLSRELEMCNSIDSITYFLQQQARNIGKNQGHDSKLMKSLKPTVNVLYILKTTVTFREDISPVFAAFAILLGVGLLLRPLCVFL
jgi:hypothetical protein